MNTKTILTVLVFLTALITMSNVTYSQDLTPVTIKVTQNSNSGIEQPNAYVVMNYVYQGNPYSQSGYTGQDGLIGFTAHAGATVFVTASYGGHTGVNCGDIVPQSGLWLTICLNDVNCCLPIREDKLITCDHNP